MRKTLKKKIGFIGLCLSASINAATPMWTYSSPNPAYVEVAPGSTRTIQYIVTNNSNRTKNLILMGAPDGFSASPCYLAGKGSTCTLTLTVNGSTLKGDVYAGPLLCEQNNINQCYQALPPDWFNVAQKPVGSLMLNSSLFLTPNGGSGVITALNNSTTIIYNLTADFTGRAFANHVTQDYNLTADFTGTALANHVTQDASQCVTLLPGQSCSITFTFNAPVVLPVQFLVKGVNVSQTAGAITVAVNPPAPLTLNTSLLVLTVGSGSGVITVTNTSTTTTASNIAADFTGTALANHVTQDASQCVTLPPGQSCSLIFTPDTTPITTVNFPIKGDNSQQVAGAIEVVLPSTAPISVSGSPLTLVALGSAGTLTVTNQSPFVTAANISANLTGTALDGQVTQDATNCVSVPPNQLCVLTFTPGSTAVSATTVPIQGSNTSLTTASITINQPQASISITGGQTMTLNTNDVHGVGWMVLHNNSATVTATNIAADFTGTALNGHVTQDASGCLSVSPAANCTLHFTVSGTSTVPSTNFGVSGSNTPQVTGNLTISTIPSGLTVGTSLTRGKIGSLYVAPTTETVCGTTSSTLYLVAANSDNSSSIAYGGTGITTNATDVTDGYANTQRIVSVLGVGTYAARLCSTYQIDQNGHAPCISGVCYQGWYLPAETENVCLYDSQTTLGGFSSTSYWGSSEISNILGRGQFFGAGGVPSVMNKSTLRPARCVRAITN